MEFSNVFESYEDRSYPYTYDGAILLDRIIGGIPSDSNVAESWLRSKLTDSSEENIQRMVAETMIERGVTEKEAVDIVNDMRHLVGFKRDSRGLYVDGRCLKSCLKEAISVAIAASKLEQRGWGETRKFLQNYFPEHVFLQEKRLHLYKKDGTPFTEPDGIEQKFVHSRFGAAIGYHEYCDNAVVNFTVRSDHYFSPDEWALIWTTAARQGFGAARSQGNGTFKVIRWDERVTPGHVPAPRKASKATKPKAKAAAATDEE